MRKAVIGLGFGDEGKGVVTDLLVCKSKKPGVVRYCGGHQAGHTVVADGFRHVFSNFGSGTFRGAMTFWADACTVDPVGILNEHSVLKEKGITPKICIQANCPIVTPYDKLANQQDKKYLENGTCGAGFGTTIQREHDGYHFVFSDMLHPRIADLKLEAICKYYGRRVPSVEFTDFMSACAFLRQSDCIIPSDSSAANKCEDLIFEGSQGLLLDKDIGFFPHVTRAKVGSFALMRYNIDQKFYVTRAYQTRHGNGPMTNEDLKCSVIRDPDETNAQHKYQGDFRISMLDINLLEYALHADGGMTKKDTLVITCLEHADGEYSYTDDGEIKTYSSKDEFLVAVSGRLSFKNVMGIENHKEYKSLILG